MAITQGTPVLDQELGRNPYWYALREDSSRAGIGATIERFHPDTSRTRFHTTCVYRSQDMYADSVILPVLNKWYDSVCAHTTHK